MIETTLAAFEKASLDALATAIRELEPSLSADEAVVVRSVLVEAEDGGWLNVRTVLTTAADAQFDKADTADLGGVRLYAWTYDPSTFKNREILTERLFAWRGMVDAPPSAGITHDPWPVRLHSGNGWHQEPVWKLDINEKKTESGRTVAARGPFINIGRRMFAHDVDSALRMWLGGPPTRQDGGFDARYHVVLPDRRAFFRGFEAEGDHLRVLVSSTIDEALYCCGTSEDVRGTAQDHIVPVLDGVAALSFLGSLRHLDLYLVADGLPWFDRYYEHEHAASWPKTIYSTHRRLWDPDYADLERVLHEGEGQTIEFKRWIAVARRDAKSHELLEVVVAFANAGGGNVYIGIDDAANVVGVNHELHKAYGAEARGDPSGMANAYIRDVKRFLAEGVTPEVSVTFTWIDMAGLDVLRVAVPDSATGAAALVESREVLIRRGATNRRAKGVEIANLEKRV